MDEKTIIRIRKGMNGFPYSACTDAGYFITNADSIEQIREHYALDIKYKFVKLVKETTLYPKGYTPDNVVYGYARESTKGQASDASSFEAQEKALRTAGASVIIRETAGATTKRPELEKLLGKLKGGDTLVVTKLDRIARSAAQGAELIKELRSRRINIKILNMGCIDSSATGKLIMDIVSGFAEFERDMIVERTQEGKAEAKLKDGYREGRPRIADINKDKMDLAMELLQTESYTQVAKMTGISKSTLVRERTRRKTEDEA